MTWRQTLGFIDDEPVNDFAAVQTRYAKLRDRPDRQICESRRLKQAVEAARIELTRKAVRRRRAG